MSRPPIPPAELRTREAVGVILLRRREQQAFSLGQVCQSLGGDVTRARLSGIERGKLPFERLLVRLASIYSTTPEAIVKEATGQSYLNLMGSILGVAASSVAGRRIVRISMTSEEEVGVRLYLEWIRYRQMVGAPVG